MLEFEQPIYDLEDKIKALQETSKANPDIKLDKEIKDLKKRVQQMRQGIFKNLSPWQKVLLARHPNRPYFMDYLNLIFKDFVEFHGDRSFHDDNAVICGLARLDKYKVFVVGQQKGKTVEDNIKFNFAMMHPEGYRKALRLMKMAEKFNRPIITFIDTPGAYPGIDAEERGQGEAIARNLLEMSLLKVPVIAVIIGEGGSGGALGIGVANSVLMLENSIYSVITPEGCASILWKDAGRAADAAAALKITAKDLLEFGIIDKIVPEPVGGAHIDYQTTADNLKKEILFYLHKFIKLPAEKLSDQRYKKFRLMGEFIDRKKTISSKLKK